jgi:hypothetical protein
MVKSSVSTISINNKEVSFFPETFYKSSGLDGYKACLKIWLAKQIFNNMIKWIQGHGAILESFQLVHGANSMCYAEALF